MSETISLLAPWTQHLVVKVRNGCNVPCLLDFNRFRYHEVPVAEKIKLGMGQPAGRNELALKLHKVICQAANSEVGKYNLFATARRHICFCDKNKFAPFIQDSVIKQLQHNNNRQRRGEIKDTTETQFRNDLASLLRVMDLPQKAWMPAVPGSGKSQTEPTRGYGDGDLKQMLPLLRILFKQLYQQFIEVFCLSRKWRISPVELVG